MAHFEVIGEDGHTYVVDDGDDDVEGDVMGDVLGYEGPMGDDEDDEGPIVVGRKRRRVRRKRSAVVRVSKPRWRGSQLAPGVIAADQGMLPLPLTGNPSDTFTAALNTITFEGQVQKPFRAERLLISVVRTGTSAVGRLIGQIFVGTDLQQLDVQGVDLELLGTPNAFGVRLTTKPCQPGVFIRLVTTLNVVLTASDTIKANMMLLGRNVH
jgi:hypothetical protein